MSTQVVVMFPYSGYKAREPRESLFWDLIDCCRQETKNQPPLVVLNVDTERRGRAKAFLANKRSERDIVIHRCWAVDTCQMWLAGWGYVIDKVKTRPEDRIVQLPGDIDTAEGKGGSRDAFFQELGAFVGRKSSWDIIIGDFGSGDMFNAKELIDLYGTYALMANWFPDLAQASRRPPLKLNRIRSEFLNIRIETLKTLLDYRKFAYEQTLNMLIRSWDFTGKIWRHKITKMDLGVLRDDSSFRQYRDCLDQIERTERMLKLLWREIDPEGIIAVSNDQQKLSARAKRRREQEFIDRYDTLDRHSTSIRESARVTIRNFLGL
jgi:hypothetical protein